MTIQWLNLASEYLSRSRGPSWLIGEASHRWLSVRSILRIAALEADKVEQPQSCAFRGVCHTLDYKSLVLPRTRRGSRKIEGI